jgi:hypothetical protein
VGRHLYDGNFAVDVVDDALSFLTVISTHNQRYLVLIALLVTRFSRGSLGTGKSSR